MYPTDDDEMLRALLDEAFLADDHTEADRLIAHIDRLDEQRLARLTAPGALAASAAWYAEHGIACFPLKPGEKMPATRNGFKDATTDLEQVRAWWDQLPQANIGLPTGISFDVVDVDGPVGYMSLATFGKPARLATVMTPRGLHFYLPPVAGRGNRAALQPGIDYRGQGGYVVAPPSRRLDGALYLWMGQPSFMVQAVAA